MELTTRALDAMSARATPSEEAPMFFLTDEVEVLCFWFMRARARARAGARTVHTRAAHHCTQSAVHRAVYTGRAVECACVILTHIVHTQGKRSTVREAQPAD